MPMITDIEDYFTRGCGRCVRFATADCSTRHWAAGIAELRRICTGAGLIETVKWGHPCYMHAGRNIAIIGALRNDFRLSFFNAALLKDPEGLLRKQGPNTQHPDMLQFSDNTQPASVRAIVSGYLKEAMGHAEKGIRAERSVTGIELPVELADALDADSELAEAFRTLTPGRQRSYVINLNGARQSATRIARIGKFRDKILAGKGATER